jgi:hypothetical protein
MWPSHRDGVVCSWRQLVDQRIVEQEEGGEMDTKHVGTVANPLAELGETRTSGTRRAPLAWQVRVATLWLVLTVGMVGATVLYLIGPGVLQEALDGEIEGEKLTDAFTLIFALFFLVPLVMAFLTLVLPEMPNRWTNGILAAIVAVMNAIDVGGHVAEGKFGGEALMMVGTVIAGLAIVWYAWRGRVRAP